MMKKLLMAGGYRWRLRSWRRVRQRRRGTQGVVNGQVGERQRIEGDAPLLADPVLCGRKH